MFTESNQQVHSRENCVEAAAEALARCYADLHERETTTAPAEARAV